MITQFFKGAAARRTLVCGFDDATIDAYAASLAHVWKLDEEGVLFDSGGGKTVTPAGNFAPSVAQSKFGGSSGLFDGTGDYLSIPSSADWAFGTGDFTIDFWVRCQQPGSGEMNFFSTANKNTTPGVLAHLRSNGLLYVYFHDQSPAFNAAAGMSVLAWYHIAIIRTGSTVRVFVNGSQIGSDYSCSQDITTLNDFQIGGGCTEGDIDYTGYIDEFRVSKGIARWTADFSGALPAAPYTSDSYTKLLLHFDSNRVDAVGGKTLVSIGNAGYTAGKDGNAFLGNGSSMALGIDENIQDWSQNWMVSLWVKTPTTLTGTDRYFLAAHNTVGTRSALAIHRYGTDYLWVEMFDGAWKQLAVDNYFAANTWNHIVICRIGSNVYVYANGVNQGTISGVGTLTVPTNFRLGCENNGSGNFDFWDSAIDECVIWENVTCSDVAAMAAALYNAAAGKFYGCGYAPTPTPTPTLTATPTSTPTPTPTPTPTV